MSLPNLNQLLCLLVFALQPIAFMFAWAIALISGREEARANPFKLWWQGRVTLNDLKIWWRDARNKAVGGEG